MGTGISQLSEEQLQQLKQNTPFDDNAIGKHLRRYARYDTSEKGTDGIPCTILQNWPEFVGHSMVPRILELYSDPQDGRLHPEGYLYMCASLNSKTAIENKKELAFKCFDVHQRGTLGTDELFRLYKLLYDGALPDEQILSIAGEVLASPNLMNPGEVSYEEFFQMVPDHEIVSRFSVDLQTL